ncbi:unnamed protein product, partial [Adineta steineri]
QVVRFYDAIAATIKDEAVNVFLEISSHPVVAKLIRECYELTYQQQSPLIPPALKRKENQQITLLTSLAQLSILSHVWQQYFHTHQILPMKNHEEYFDNCPLYKFHLSSCWYESKDSSIQRLANRIPTHPLLGIRQFNGQTNHKIQDAILFPAVAYLELATAACHQLLSSKEDDQQQPTIIFEDVKFVKVLILNEHELVEFSKIQTLSSTSTTIISQLSNDNNNCSSYYLLHPYLVLLSGIETTFLPVRIQKFIYSSKTKTKMNQSTNIEVRGNYHDNICGIGQEEIYSLDLWTFPMDNKIEEPIFTFEGAVIQQVQGAHSGRWSIEKTIYDKLNLTTDLPNTDHKTYLNTIVKDYCMKRVWTDSPITKDISHLLPSPKSILNNELNSNSNQDLIESIEPCNELAVYYAQMAIKDLNLNQQHHPLLNASLNKYGSHLKDILSGEKNGLDIFVGDEEIAQTFQQVKTLISAIKTQQIFHSICQYLQLQYEQTKDNSFENYRLRIFWLTDSHCSDVLPILDLLLNLSRQSGNQDLTNSLISLRRLLVPNGLLLLLELVHIPLYFDLIFGFFDQWWSSDNNNRSLNNIQQWTTLRKQIKGFNIIESTLNQNETLKQNEELLCGTLSRILQTTQESSPHFHPFVYVLTDHAQFNNDSNLNIIASLFIGLARSLVTEYERNRLKLIDLQTSLNNKLIFIHTLIEYMINARYSTDTCEVVLRLNHTNQNQVQHLTWHYEMLQRYVDDEQEKSKFEQISIIPKRDADQKLFRLCVPPSRFLSELTWTEEDREKELLPGMVEVRVHCVGINSRDVLKSRGLYPYTRTFAQSDENQPRVNQDTEPGSDFVGTIVRA